MSPVGRAKFLALANKMASLEIHEEDIVEKFLLGSGKGGQKVNKSSTCVYLKHIPTGIEVKCQKERSREANRFFARRLLLEKIESEVLKIKTEKDKQRHKIRKQKQKRSKRQKEKILKEKKIRSEKKQLRSKPEH